jgi:hypothetical protein
MPTVIRYSLFVAGRKLPATPYGDGLRLNALATDCRPTTGFRRCSLTPNGEPTSVASYQPQSGPQARSAQQYAKRANGAASEFSCGVCA